MKKNSLKQHTQKYLKNRFLIIVFFMAIVSTLLILFSLYDAFLNKKPLITPERKVVKLGVVRRSSDPQKITEVTTAITIDAITGKVIHPSRTFTLSDKDIYLVVKLNSPSVGSYVDYLRYFNGKYVDHGEISITNPHAKDVVFVWNKPSRTSVESGTYTVTTYYNGVFEKRLDYTIQNKLAIANPK